MGLSLVKRKTKQVHHVITKKNHGGRWMMHSHALEELALVVVEQHVNEEKLPSFVAKSRHGKWAVELGTSPS